MPPASALSGLRVSPPKFSFAGRKVKGHCVKPTKSNNRAPRCRRAIKLNVSYNLNVAATVTFTFKRQAPGRRIKGRCVKPTKTNRKHKRCTRLIKVRGRITRTGSAGANKFAFNGRISGHRLGSGIYQLIATPAGGAAHKVTFRIVA